MWVWRSRVISVHHGSVDEHVVGGGGLVDGGAGVDRPPGDGHVGRRRQQVALLHRSAHMTTTNVVLLKKSAIFKTAFMKLESDTFKYILSNVINFLTLML